MKIAITIDGGIIQNIYSDEPIDVRIVDYDIEGCAYDDIHHIPFLENADNPSGEYFVYPIESEPLPEQLWKEINET